MNNTPSPLIPIYTSKGDAEAFLRYPYLLIAAEIGSALSHPIGKCTPCSEISSAH